MESGRDQRNDRLTFLQHIVAIRAAIVTNIWKPGFTVSEFAVLFFGLNDTERSSPELLVKS